MRAFIITLTASLVIAVISAGLYLKYGDELTNTNKENNDAIENTPPLSPLDEARNVVAQMPSVKSDSQKVVEESFRALEVLEEVNESALTNENDLFTDLYKALIEVYETKSNSSDTRSEAVIAINKVAYISYFNPTPINNALVEYDGGRLYNEFLADPHTSDTPTGIAYKAWYHFNTENYTNNISDPYFAGVAGLIIAFSLIDSPPGEDWHDDFMSYIVDTYEQVWPEEFNTEITQLDQLLWLQNTMLIARLRLEDIYGKDVEYSLSDYKKRFDKIIEDSNKQEDKTILAMAQLGLLVSLYEKQADAADIEFAAINFVDSAERLDASWFRPVNRNLENNQGFLLKKLEKIAETNSSIKILLKTNGWSL